jgi:peptidyl-prolyl cis-trans isomerase C
VARARDYVLTLKDLKELLSEYPPQMFASFEKRKEAVEGIILTKIFIALAQREALDQDPEIQMTRQKTREQALRSAYTQKHFDSITISDEQARRYYDSHKEEFSNPETIKARHIVVKSEAEAKAIKADLAAGARFDSLARQRSIDEATRANGGDLGWIPRGSKPAEFETVAFGLAAGQVSDPLKVASGYEILHVEAKLPAKLTPFEEVKTRVARKLKEQAIAQAKRALAQEWGMTIDEEALMAAGLVAGISEPMKVVAKAGDYVITVKDFSEILHQYPQIEFTPESRRDLLENLVLTELYGRAARKEGLDNDPGVQKRLQEATERVLALAYYEKHIAAAISEDQARRYFETHRQEFITPKRVKVRHIVLKTEEEAKAVRAQLDQGAAFEDLAKARSIDVHTSDQGGDLGWIAEGALSPEFENVAFKLEPNQISEIVKTPAGFEIVKVEQRLIAPPVTFADVQRRITIKLQKEMLEAKKKQLMAEWNATIDEALLKIMKPRP